MSPVALSRPRILPRCALRCSFLSSRRFAFRTFDVVVVVVFLFSIVVGVATTTAAPTTLANSVATLISAVTHRPACRPAISHASSHSLVPTKLTSAPIIWRHLASYYKRLRNHKAQIYPPKLSDSLYLPSPFVRHNHTTQARGSLNASAAATLCTQVVPYARLLTCSSLILHSNTPTAETTTDVDNLECDCSLLSRD